jgi:hypothetical protein
MKKIYLAIAVSFICLTIGLMMVAKKEQQVVVIELQLPAHESVPYVEPVKYAAPMDLSRWKAPVAEPAGI